MEAAKSAGQVQRLNTAAGVVAEQLQFEGDAGGGRHGRQSSSGRPPSMALRSLRRPARAVDSTKRRGTRSTRMWD